MYPEKHWVIRVNGLHGKDIGRKTCLTNEEEISLINYIKYMSSHSFPLNIKQIRRYAWGIVLQNGCSD